MFFGVIFSIAAILIAVFIIIVILEGNLTDDEIVGIVGMFILAIFFSFLGWANIDSSFITEEYKSTVTVGVKHPAKGVSIINVNDSIFVDTAMVMFNSDSAIVDSFTVNYKGNFRNYNIIIKPKYNED